MSQSTCKCQIWQLAPHYGCAVSLSPGSYSTVFCKGRVRPKYPHFLPLTYTIVDKKGIPFLSLPQPGSGKLFQNSLPKKFFGHLMNEIIYPIKK